MSFEDLPAVTVCAVAVCVPQDSETENYEIRIKNNRSYCLAKEAVLGLRIERDACSQGTYYPIVSGIKPKKSEG